MTSPSDAFTMTDYEAILRRHLLAYDLRVPDAPRGPREVTAIVDEERVRWEVRAYVPLAEEAPLPAPRGMWGLAQEVRRGRQRDCVTPGGIGELAEVGRLGAVAVVDGRGERFAMVTVAAPEEMEREADPWAASADRFHRPMWFVKDGMLFRAYREGGPEPVGALGPEMSAGGRSSPRQLTAAHLIRAVGLFRDPVPTADHPSVTIRDLEVRGDMGSWRPWELSVDLHAKVEVEPPSPSGGPWAAWLDEHNPHRVARLSLRWGPSDGEPRRWLLQHILQHEMLPAATGWDL